MIAEPTMKIIGWAATRTAELIVERVADRIAKKAKTRVAEAAGFANQRVRAGGKV
ncbi:hypothetical protein J4O76_05280 [Sphingomonas sp. NFX23]